MRPSATSSSNFVAETPIYIADSSRDRPRRGTGLISERARTVIVTRPLRPAAGRLDPEFARDGLRAELRCGVAVFYPHIDVRGFDAECSIESLLRSPDWKVGRLRYCFFMKKGAAPKDSEPNMVAGIVSSIPAKIVVDATQPHERASFVLCLFVSPKNFSKLLVTSANTSDRGITAKARFGSSISSDDLGVGRFPIL
jgi:hypothetical protein